MSFINRAQISDVSGKYQGATSAPESSWPYHAGIRHMGESCETATVAHAAPIATDCYVNGMRLTSTGKLYTWDFDTLGLPPGGAVGNSGYLLTHDGALITTGDPVVFWSAGWPIAGNSFVAIDAAPSAPGAFTFSVVVFVEQVAVGWTSSVGATSYQIKQDGVLIHTSFPPDDFYIFDIPPPGTYACTMFAVNGGGTTASTSNPQPFTTP